MKTTQRDPSIEMETGSDHRGDLENQQQETKSIVSLGKRLADAHDNLLSPSKARMVMVGMSLSLIAAAIDLNGMSIVMPYIAQSIGAQLTISWASTSQLIGMALSQLLCGRFADIFGRKNYMVLSILFMGSFELACALSQTAVQFFIFRALCGFANGNIASLSMVVMSDIVPLRERGSYQGYLSISNGIGNVAAPFLASAYIQHSTWRKYFYTLFALSVSSTLIIAWLVPNTRATDISMREKFKNIDYLGFVSGGLGLVLILVPVNGGGLQFDWASAKVIVMLVIGGISGITFILIEAKVASLPLVPMKLFTESMSLSFTLFQFTLSGLAFYSVYFYYGYYFEIVRGLSPIITSCFFLCIIIPHYTCSGFSGKIITWRGHYNPTIRAGFGSWTVASILLATVVNEHTPLVGVAFIMILTGIGIGLMFQSTLVAALANSRQEDRAVVISTRQVLRYFGGSIGLAIGSLIFSTSFLRYLNSDSFVNEPSNLSLKIYLRQHVYSKIDVNSGLWNNEQLHYIKVLYMKSLKHVFIYWSPIIGTCFIISLFVQDKGLVSKQDEKSGRK